MLQAARGVVTPGSNTGVENTEGRFEVGLHWLRGTTKSPVDSVVHVVARELGESVVVLGGGAYGYAEGYGVGPVRIYHSEKRPDMGVCVDFTGSACEELGARRVGRLHGRLGLRASRVDFAVDGCEFTPRELADEWRRDNVRTRAKVPADALPGREWRSCKFIESPTGDTFSMGARQSNQYARCYDMRGFTRFELELKGATAPVAAAEYFAAVQTGGEESVRLTVLSWIRRFVDFVEAAPGSNRARAPLLSFWGAFVSGVEKATVVLEGAVTRTVEQVRGWVERQVAPGLAVVVAALGMDALHELAAAGRKRLRPRHMAMLREHRAAAL